jgi:hypothetical protein
MPYDTYRLYQIERARAPARSGADEQATRLASAVSSLVRGITRPARKPLPAAARGLSRPA